MRNTIFFLVFLMFLLICNIIAYSFSEDYRFFLKKIKYREEIVYDTSNLVDDANNHIKIIQKTPTGEQETSYIEKESITFLDTLAGNNVDSDTIKNVLPELTKEEQDFISIFSNFGLEQVQQKSSLFDLTTEYPDEYYEYYTEDLSIYVFPTKKYEQVYNIFDVLAFELPYKIKKVNNFGQESFYVNIDKSYNDNTIRIVLKYKNRAFGLKIKKDRYNDVKEVLQEL